MRILVLGVGKQGSVLVRDLIESHEVLEVVASDIKEKGVMHDGKIG